MTLTTVSTNTTVHAPDTIGEYNFVRVGCRLIDEDGNYIVDEEGNHIVAVHELNANVLHTSRTDTMIHAED